MCVSTERDHLTVHFHLLRIKLPQSKIFMLSSNPFSLRTFILRLIYENLFFIILLCKFIYMTNSYVNTLPTALTLNLY